MSEWFTLRQLAQAAGCSLETVRRDTRRGVLRAEKRQGVRGLRVRQDSASRYLSLKWPQAVKGGSDE